MSKKKILIVTQKFYPIIAPRSFRSTELAKELARQGHEVTVLTCKNKFNYDHFSKINNIKIDNFVYSKLNVDSKKNILIRGFRIILQYFFLYPEILLVNLIKKALIQRSGYDLLISVAGPYPVHWGVALAKIYNNNLCKIWVADCGDPFIGNKEKRINQFYYFRYIEKWFCKKPDFLTIPIKEAIEAYPMCCRSKIKIIPQGFNFDEVNSTISQVKNPYPLFAYAGAFSKGFRDPGQFLEYLCTKTDMKFKFIVYTKHLSMVEPYKKQLGEKLEIRDYVAREQLLEELKKVDFLVNFENLNNFQKPSKLIDYALTGKPIISIKPQNLNPKMVEEFMQGNYSNQIVIEDVEQYNIKNIAKQFISLLKY